MNFSKQMIDLVREIRRRVASQDKPGIKLANPELLTELVPIYHRSTDTVTNTLIKELFHLAGDDWPQRLLIRDSEAERQPQATSPEKVYVTKVYRGQTQLIEVERPTRETAKPQRIYRGQVVVS